MNRRITHIFAATLAIAAILFISYRLDAGEQKTKPGLNFEKVQGEVRVVLLRAGQVPSTNGQTAFVVTYIVEIPMKGAFSDLHFSSDKEVSIEVRGKPIKFSGSTSGSSSDFKDLPGQSELTKPVGREGMAMLAQERIFKDLKIDAKTVDLRIR